MALTPIDPRDLERRRMSMVAGQLRLRGICDERVLRAMAEVPRERFVPPSLHDASYADGPLPIGEGQTISQPYMVAVTCERARLRGTERVLEVGAGSGYQAAVLGRLARQVVTIERVPALAEVARRNLWEAGASNVEVVLGDGTLGWPAGAPYDAIVVAAAAPSVPGALVDQLAPGGRLVLPVGTRRMQELTVFVKGPDGLERLRGEACVFVPLIGADGFPDDAPARR